ncbi:MAG: 30S ribosomal protein S9 [Planctomycetota bacterium]|jgi:small subunit ribosomal protein S9
MAGSETFIWGTGRRKSSVARVRVRSGGGKIEVNGKEYKEYFPTEGMRTLVLAPLQATENQSSVDVYVNVKGGGPVGQAGAVRLGIARALMNFDAGLESPLRDGGFLTRDARMKERKKYGQRGARRKFQFSKR